MSPRKRALVIEEDQDMASELNSLLESLGFTVTILRDPTLTTNALGTHQYEVALMNMALQEMTWRSTLQTVKNASRNTTVITMRRSANEEDVRLALNAGAYVVLDRPLTQDQLASLISPQCDGMFVALRG